MTRRDWLLVIAVIGIGIVLQIPGMKGEPSLPVIEPSGGQQEVADLPDGGKTISLAVSGMT